jgi:hypothetical protein
VPRADARANSGRICFALIIALLGTACREPVLIFPGGKLHGELRANPGPHVLLDGHATAQLETRPEDPYSVNITYTVVGGRTYVNAGDQETTWAKNAIADPRVRLRVGSALYELRAVRVTDREELGSFARAWLRQSWTRKDPSLFEQVWLFRLDPR